MMVDPILVLDVAAEGRSEVIRTLQHSGYSVESADTGREVLEKLGQQKFSMIIADTGHPERSGMEVLSEVKAVSPQMPVIVVTANGSVNHAVKAMQAGASDYILKPFSSDTLKTAVKKICAHIQQADRFAQTHTPGSDRGDTKQLIAQDPKMLQILMMAKNVAPSRATVLIQGESGTGKEVLAAFIHHHSGRRNKPFVALNCAALPDSLAESELFGHEKGAFTGAFSRKAGKFELADGGTLLLDEISEMAPPMQAKLLRVLQEQEIDRIGGIRPIPINTRVIAVSNVDLKAAVADGRFREDLYYRINVVPLTIPPLRERKDDIPLLSQFFLKKFSRLNTRDMGHIDDQAMAALISYPWKGNVRELENVIERAVLLGSGTTLRAEHLMMETAAPESEGGMVIRAGMSMKEMEKNLIFHTLKEVDDNRTHAAQLLGISIRTLRNKLKEYREKAAA